MAVDSLFGMSPAVTEQLRAFYVAHRQQLYTYALSITRHREGAEDAIHAAFQRLLRRGEIVADLRPYVFRCVRNAALDAQRRAAIRGDSIFVLDDVPDETAAPAVDSCSAREVGLKVNRFADDRMKREPSRARDVRGKKNGYGVLGP